MSAVKIGIVGCGVIGEKHLYFATQSPAIEVVAIADKNRKASTQLAQKYQVAKVFDCGYDLLKKSDVEAVVLAFPTAGRANMAAAALDSNRHVLLEKPVAMNATEVVRLLEIQRDLVLASCSSRYRFLAGARAASEFVLQGQLGKIRVVRCRVLHAVRPLSAPSPIWRSSRSLNGGGILANYGTYDLDFLMGILNWSLTPVSVFAQTWKIPPQFESRIPSGSDGESHGLMLIRCQQGEMIYLERGEYICGEPYAAWEIIGEKGTLKLMMTGNKEQPKVLIHETCSNDGQLHKNIVWQGMEDCNALNSGPVLDFASAIINNHQPMTNLRQALIIQQIFDAAYASAQMGQSVEISGYNSPMAEGMVS